MKDGSELLREWRDSMGLSQSAAARLAGVSQPAWSDWESRHKRPKVPQAIRLSELSGGAVPVEAWRHDVRPEPRKPRVTESGPDVTAAADPPDSKTSAA